MLEKKTQHSLRKYKNTESVRVGTGQPFNVFNYPATLPSLLQETWSEDHGFKQAMRDIREYESQFGRMKTVADIGGEFLSVKRRYREGSQEVSLQSGSPATSVERKFVGTQQAYSYDTAPYPPIVPIDRILMNAYGVKARSLVDPTNPATSVGTGMGELRETNGVPGIPGAALLKERARIFKGLGSEYLNVQFGWNPFVSDVRAAASTAKKAIHLLRQYERNRGRAVRRRFSFPTVTESAEFAMGSVTPSPPISSAFYDTYKGALSRREVTNLDVWFSGSFTYYVTPSMSNGRLAAYEAAADRLLGSRLTPELVWNLAPWSWLTDWFFDIGAFIGNLDAMILDGSVMWYGYVMAHREVSHLYQLSGYGLTNHASPVLWQEFISESKQRIRATPFGFGLSPNADFSMKQWSILAALGITRV